ncbi:MAG: polyphenol oxidase family protein [Actinobacteria bacterium]|nr:polyphenol oxidase family protein [Actinomycetota bacterium]
MLDRREIAPGAYALVSTTLENEGFLAAFTERSGGASSEPRFSSLNLSYSSGDDPTIVGRNRDLVTSALDAGPFAVGGQVHGSRLAAVGSGRAGSGYDGPQGVIPETDGLHSKTARVSMAVATADCVPVILAGEGRICVVHAGWRGVAAGIVDRSIGLFSDVKSMRVAIGPAAGGCCYEVGEDVVAAVASGTAGQVVTTKESNRPHLDLAATIASTCRALGVSKVEVAGLCTIHEEDRFFSHRRQGPCGRQFAIAMKR